MNRQTDNNASEKVDDHQITVGPSKPTKRVKGNGRNHWMPIHANDWLNDECLSECSPATQGIWFRMLLVMWTNEGYELVGIIGKLALKIGRLAKEVRSAIFELAETGTADVFVMAKDGKTLLPFSKLHGKPMAKDVLVIRNRRMHKERSLSNLRSEAGRIGAEKRWQTDSKDDGKRMAPSSSCSISSSLSSSTSSSPISPSTYDARTHASPTPLENDDARTRTAAAAPADDDERTTQRTHDARAPLRAYAELAKPASGGEFADEDDIPF